MKRGCPQAGKLIKRQVKVATQIHLLMSESCLPVAQLLVQTTVTTGKTNTLLGCPALGWSCAVLTTNME